MKITIESTPELMHVNGLPVRVWAGTTERGTPILALVTRLAVPEGADASELERELAKPPTRVRDAGGEYIAEPRSCTVCLARNLRRPATHVARDPSGLEWFECGRHDPIDNVAETVRVALEPIAAWFDRHELPLPGGQPPRLTEAERKALNALHRWLHSPTGDGMLTDEAQDFHTQVEAECASECDRLEEEERLAHGRLVRYGSEASGTEETTAEQLAGVCRVCGCTDADCRQCIIKTGTPCYWVESDLCSACAEGQLS
jgi:hypothetical protein